MTVKAPLPGYGPVETLSARCGDSPQPNIAGRGENLHGGCSTGSRGAQTSGIWAARSGQGGGQPVRGGDINRTKPTADRGRWFRCARSAERCIRKAVAGRGLRSDPVGLADATAEDE